MELALIILLPYAAKVGPPVAYFLPFGGQNLYSQAVEHSALLLTRIEFG